MRLHRLEITAFGPFADTVEVDFDELSAAGLFLLTGATGAGKTSVLDAVCFALYGQVPGDRSGARHLRSDHARPGVPPRVVLHASIGDRTFRFTRSPAWSRPKQRGSGETRVPAHVLVEERGADTWVALTHRLDDAGLLVGELLGMTATQFTQVAMLPQGRFQAFLRASSTERHAVLQRLFRTDRFERIERWLVERRLAAARASDEAAHDLRAVLHRAQEVSGADLPDDWADGLARAADRGEVASWSRDLLTTAEAARGDAERDLAVAEAALSEADALLAQVRRVHDLRARAEVAAREIMSLDERTDELGRLRDALACHRRAAPLAGAVAHAAGCRRVADRAATAWSAHRAAVGDTAGEAVGDVLAALHQEAVAAHAVADAFRPRARELGGLRARCSELGSRVSAVAESLAALDAAVAAHPGALATARAAVDEARVAAAGLPAVHSAVADLEEQQAAVARHGALAAELVSARADLTHAKAEALAAKESYLGIREARINGMAAELAGAPAARARCAGAPPTRPRHTAPASPSVGPRRTQPARPTRMRHSSSRVTRYASPRSSRSTRFSPSVSPESRPLPCPVGSPPSAAGCARRGRSRPSSTRGRLWPAKSRTTPRPRARPVTGRRSSWPPSSRS